MIIYGFCQKKKGLKFPRQLIAVVFLDSLLLKFSSVVNCSRFHNSAVNCRGAFSSFTCVFQLNQMCQQQFFGFIKDIPDKIGGIYIPVNFVVVDIEEDFEVPILLGRPFLATAGAIIDVKRGRIIFQVSDEIVGFEIETLNKDHFDFSCCMIDDHSVKEHSLASSTQHDLFNPP